MSCSAVVDGQDVVDRRLQWLSLFFSCLFLGGLRPDPESRPPDPGSYSFGCSEESKNSNLKGLLPEIAFAINKGAPVH